MPGMYAEGDYDLAGFCVGVVERDRIIDGSRVRRGDAIIGLASSGPHSNGYSLIRRLIADCGADAATEIGGERLLERLMVPTRIYVRSILALATATEIGAVAHITGGGLADNIPRVLPEGCGARLKRTALLRDPVWAWIQKAGRIVDAEMYRTFNCGIGMIVVLPADAAGSAIATLRAAGEHADVIGEIVAGEGVQIGG
jgi:phosphoribosylformylglycinamidine cyclo-ligase